MENETELLRQTLVELEEYKKKYEQLKISLQKTGSKNALSRPNERRETPAEHSLQTLLFDILDDSPIPIFVIDKRHNVVKWNKALERYSGIKAAEITGTDYHWRLFFAEKQPLLADLLLDEDQEKIPSIYEEYSESNLVEGAYEGIRPVTVLGIERWIHFTASAIKNSNGNIVGAMETLKDITDSKLAEEEARESREYLDQIINRISDLVFVKDVEHKYVLLNDALCASHGKPREQLIGQYSFDDLPQEMAAPLIEREAEVFRTGIEGLSEDKIVDCNGKFHTLLAKKALLVDKKGNRQIVGVLRDITNYKLLEAQFIQAQKMEAIGALAGGVAHDFNNLLNVINGYCELVLEELSENEPIRQDILQISQAGTRAKLLIAQLLAFSRKQILQPEALNLNETIDATSSMLRRLIPENIDVVVYAHPGLGLIYADPGQIQQILMNLVVNARDAMPGGGKLTIETANVDYDEEYIRNHPVTKPGPYVMMAISDNGAGMDERTRTHLFEPFFTTKEKGKGTGLGLSTVYGIVKQSDGFIWVYSEPGQGASFKIYFPRVEGMASRFEEETDIVGTDQGVETILIAEDEDSVRNLAVRVLRERGYVVLEASNGQDALEVVQKFSGEIHLAITDVIMPGINGKDLIARIKSMRPNIKALFVSGYTDNAIVHHGVLDSGVEFLQKPFSIRNLARKIREMLNS
jgi:two-component system, cell cycle sensor histidine kinase and response regulator CckA